jgi:hypothetical protein
MKPKHDKDIELLMTDTDSLVYCFHTEDFYKDMYEMKMHFDMSEYSKQNPMYHETNKKVNGKSKDETGDKVIKDLQAFTVKYMLLKPKTQ